MKSFAFINLNQDWFSDLAFSPERKDIDMKIIEIITDPDHILTRLDFCRYKNSRLGDWYQIDSTIFLGRTIAEMTETHTDVEFGRLVPVSKKTNIEIINNSRHILTRDDYVNYGGNKIIWFRLVDRDTSFLVGDYVSEATKKYPEMIFGRLVRRAGSFAGTPVRVDNEVAAPDISKDPYVAHREMLRSKNINVDLELRETETPARIYAPIDDVEFV